MSRRGKQPDHSADTRGGRWTGIPHVVIASPAYRSLGMTARAVLIEIATEFNGFNNGGIALSFDQLTERLGTTNRRAIGAAFAELVDRGLVAIEAPASRKHHKAREYRLTFVSTSPGGRHQPATNDYLGWTPSAQNHGDDALPRTPVHGDDASLKPGNHGDDASPRIVQYRRKMGLPV